MSLCYYCSLESGCKDEGTEGRRGEEEEREGGRTDGERKPEAGVMEVSQPCAITVNIALSGRCAGRPRNASRLHGCVLLILSFPLVTLLCSSPALFHHPSQELPQTMKDLPLFFFPAPLLLLSLSPLPSFPLESFFSSLRQKHTWGSLSNEGDEGKKNGEGGQQSPGWCRGRGERVQSRVIAVLRMTEEGTRRERRKQKKDAVGGVTKATAEGAGDEGC